jgi:hypothetical protein
MDPPHQTFVVDQSQNLVATVLYDRISDKDKDPSFSAKQGTSIRRRLTQSQPKRRVAFNAAPHFARF